MVSFQCDACQDVVKKPKLDTHSYKCYTSFTCVDCSKTFHSPAEWKGHTSCISEAEKYQKGLYRGKKNKNDTSGPRGDQSVKPSNGNPSDPSDSINTNTASPSSDSANPKPSAEADAQSAAPQIEEGSRPHTANEGEGETKQSGEEKKNKKKRRREEERKDPPNDTSTNAQVKEKKKKKTKKDAEDDGANANADVKGEGNAMQLDPAAYTSIVPTESHTTNTTQEKNKKNKGKKNKGNSAQGAEGQTGISSVFEVQASSSSSLNKAENQAGKKRKAKGIGPDLNAPGESSRAVSDEAPRKKRKDKSKKERKNEAAVKEKPISETRVDEKNGKQSVNEGDEGAPSEGTKRLKPRHRSRKGKKEKEGTVEGQGAGGS